MKKKLLVGTMALCLSASLFGCGGGNATTTAPTTTAPTTTAPTTEAPAATTTEAPATTTTAE